MSPKSDLFRFFPSPRFPMLLALAILAWLPVLFSPALYYDDALRIYTHTSINQGVHGRPLADYIYSFFSSGFFNDISPLSQIVCMAAIIGGATLAADAFRSLLSAQQRRFINWLPLLPALIPLQYAIICFRYDSLTFGFAIFCACFAVKLVATGAGFGAILATGILVFCILCIYQPMLTIFFCLLSCFLALASLKFSPRAILPVLCRGAIACIIGCLLYIPVYLHARKMAFSPFCGLENHPYVVMHSGILPAGELVNGILANLSLYLKTAASFIGADFLSVCFCAGIVLGLLSIITSKAAVSRKAAALLFAILAFFSCGAYGFLLTNPSFQPRTLISLCFYIFCMFLIAVVAKAGWLRKLAIAASIFCMIMSAFFLASLGNAQRDQANFENAMIVEPLTNDFMELYQKTGPFSFFTRNNVPLHFSLAEISRKYGFVGHISGSVFLLMREMSWMKLHYALKTSMDPAISDILEKAPIVVSRLSYDIKDCGGKTFAVILKNDYVPNNTQKFQSD